MSISDMDKVVGGLHYLTYVSSLVSLNYTCLPLNEALWSATQTEVGFQILVTWNYRMASLHKSQIHTLEKGLKIYGKCHIYWCVHPVSLDKALPVLCIIYGGSCYGSGIRVQNRKMIVKVCIIRKEVQPMYKWALRCQEIAWVQQSLLKWKPK